MTNFPRSPRSLLTALPLMTTHRTWTARTVWRLARRVGSLSPHHPQVLTKTRGHALLTTLAEETRRLRLTAHSTPRSLKCMCARSAGQPSSQGRRSACIRASEILTFSCGMRSCTLEMDFPDVSLVCTDGLSYCSPMLFFGVAVGLSWIVMFLDFECI